MNTSSPKVVPSLKVMSSPKVVPSPKVMSSPKVVPSPKVMSSPKVLSSSGTSGPLAGPRPASSPREVAQSPVADSSELSESQTKKLKIGADGLEVPPPDIKRQKTVESLTSAGSGSEALESCRSPSVSGFAPDEMAAGIVTARKVAMLLEQFKAISQDSGVTAHTRELLDELMALCCNKLDRVRLSASRKRGR